MNLTPASNESPKLHVLGESSRRAEVAHPRSGTLPAVKPAGERLISACHESS
jgi:hypothetical protein